MTIRAFLLTILALGSASAATAQTPPPGAAPVAAPQIRVYLDCQYECDFDFLRTNVPFVDWVRDRASSDIHLLVTTQTTGGGGWNWTLKFIGGGALQGVDETLTFATASTDTSDARRKELARIIRLGLTRYAVRSGNLASLDVTFKPPAAAAAAAPQKDPWNYWVFSTSANGNLSGERSTKSRRLSMGLSASRVTANWKINLSANNSHSENRFEISETATVRSLTRSWSINSLFVKSLGEHLSAGVRSNLNGSTFSNQDFVLRVMPAVEFDVFPNLLF